MQFEIVSDDSARRKAKILEHLRWSKEIAEFLIDNIDMVEDDSLFLETLEDCNNEIKEALIYLDMNIKDVVQ